jgi:hypothetical protein
MPNASASRLWKSSIASPTGADRESDSTGPRSFSFGLGFVLFAQLVDVHGR